MEVKSNIQCWIFTMKTQLYEKTNEFLVNFNTFDSDIYIYDIANMICQLHHLQLEYFFIQQKNELNS